jgi:AcrR family transcriptional regulator
MIDRRPRTGAKKASNPNIGAAERRGKRKRMDPADREKEILDGAVAFFAEFGFDASLRDLAARLDITHQNLFRYFPTKEALIERVYKEVYLNRWQPEWELLLCNPAFSLEQRLIAFYTSYMAVVNRYEWVRIFVFAGLRGITISQRYLELIQKKVIEPLAIELRTLCGTKPGSALSPEELEIAWSLHGELFYFAIRRWVYGMPTSADVDTVIKTSVKRFLDGAPKAMRTLKNVA